MMNSTTRTTSSSPMTFETSSRKLENFLYAHDIEAARYYKDIDGLTVWVYPDNEEVRECVDEYRRIVAKRQARMVREAWNNASREA